MSESTISQVALTPPMGWNSWDCYGASVTEEELLGNAEYMAKHMKKYGWEYVICDIQWYEPTANSSWYHKFADLCMDEYSRLIPAENRFPSSVGGVGFTNIAEQVHRMGLKFGIHIMRGIPRQAVHQNRKIKGVNATARDIAHPYSLCSWNTDMYGVDPNQPGAQEYYNSLFELYASWGVDYVKVDDICVTEFKPQDPYSAKLEIEMIRKAIDQCGRPMVLSLSPGPAVLTEAEHLSAHANLWRMTGDFWDRWNDLKGMFDKCAAWASYVKPHSWPDCDMIPVGHIGIRAREHNLPDRFTNFTKEEQITLMTLWSIFKSPLMVGCELRDNDEFTLGLFTNEDVLRMNQEGKNPRELYRTNDYILWQSEGPKDSIYLAVFNVSEGSVEITIDLDKLGFLQDSYIAKELWSKNTFAIENKHFTVTLPAHGAACYEINHTK